MDSIFIRDLRLKGKHGVSDAERGREQEFVFDISIDFDTRPSVASDDLDDTVDYDYFRNAATLAVQRSSFHLLEKLADEVAGKILLDKRIKQVSVTVRKTEMYADCTPGVTIVRTQ